MNLTANLLQSPMPKRSAPLSKKLQSRFMHNPVGLFIEDEPYVRSPQQIKDNGSMAFYCGVGEGMELSLLESTDIIEDTRNAINKGHGRTRQAFPES